jgi:hypothetical protein
MRKRPRGRSYRARRIAGEKQANVAAGAVAGGMGGGCFIAIGIVLCFTVVGAIIGIPFIIIGLGLGTASIVGGGAILAAQTVDGIAQDKKIIAAEDLATKPAQDQPQVEDYPPESP